MNKLEFSIAILYGAIAFGLVAAAGWGRYKKWLGIK